jgi:hypothetical protein
MVIVGLADESFFDETVAGNFSHSVQNAGIFNATADKLAFHHAVASCGILHLTLPTGQTARGLR